MPTVSPITEARTDTPSTTTIEVRAPWTTASKTTRPRLSVPIQWVAGGPERVAGRDDLGEQPGDQDDKGHDQPGHARGMADEAPEGGPPPVRRARRVAGRRRPGQPTRCRRAGAGLSGSGCGDRHG